MDERVTSDSSPPAAGAARRTPAPVVVVASRMDAATVQQRSSSSPSCSVSIQIARRGVRSASCSRTMSCPCRAVSPQWTCRIGSPARYGRTARYSAPCPCAGAVCASGSTAATVSTKRRPTGTTRGRTRVRPSAGTAGVAPRPRRGPRSEASPSWCARRRVSRALRSTSPRCGRRGAACRPRLWRRRDARCEHTRRHATTATRCERQP